MDVKSDIGFLKSNFYGYGAERYAKGSDVHTLCGLIEMLIDRVDELEQKIEKFNNNSNDV